MTVQEAAELLGVTPLTVRIGLQKGAFPFGTAFKTSEDSKHYTYVIYPEIAKQYIGEKKK